MDPMALGESWDRYWRRRLSRTGSIGTGFIQFLREFNSQVSSVQYFNRLLSGIRLMCVALTGWSFRNYENEETTQFSNSLVEIASRQAAAESGNASKFRSIVKAFKQRTTLIGALFIFAYQGIEVSESGWFISYDKPSQTSS